MVYLLYLYTVSSAVRLIVFFPGRCHVLPEDDRESRLQGDTVMPGWFPLPRFLENATDRGYGVFVLLRLSLGLVKFVSIYFQIKQQEEI